MNSTQIRESQDFLSLMSARASSDNIAMSAFSQRENLISVFLVIVQQMLVSATLMKQ